MNHILEFCLFLALGYLGITNTYPIVIRLPRGWRWIWSIVLLGLYFTTHGLLEKFWPGYCGAFGFFEFLAGAILASASIQKSKNIQNEKGE